MSVPTRFRFESGSFLERYLLRTGKGIPYFPVSAHPRAKDRLSSSRQTMINRFRLWLLDIEVPSGPPSLLGKTKVRLLALLPVRNHLRYLPGYIRNVSPQVDGIVALDDGSTDGSAEYLENRPEVLEVIRIPSSRPMWDEIGNHRRLLSGAIRHGAEWVVNIDADERLERDFRQRCERVIGRGRWLGYKAYGLHLRDLWDSPHQYRVDGIWGCKTTPRLYKALANHQFDSRELHGSKAPLQARVGGRYPIADLNIYHLGMLMPELRKARRERYEALDPTARWQPRLGYAYLTDTTNLQVARIPARRGYVEVAASRRNEIAPKWQLGRWPRWRDQQ